MNIQLNEDQLAASEHFLNFLLGEDLSMTITGGAGVGKTTLLKHLVEQFYKYQETCRVLGTTDIMLHNIAMTATTNKAAGVLAQAVGAHNFQVDTIHQLLGLRVHNDYATGESRLVPKGKTELPEKRLIVIDEASMIDPHLYDYLDKRSIGCKFLFIGDHCQMAPVRYSLSPVFQNTDTTFKLNKIMRSLNSPPITELNLKLRQGVEDVTFFPIEEVPGYIEYLDNEAYKAKLQEYFMNQDNNARILSYTNERVHQYNFHLRAMRGQTMDLVDGDHVACNNAVISGGAFFHVEEELFIDKVIETVPASEYNKLLGQFPNFMLKHASTRCGRKVVFPKSSLEYHNLIKATARAKNWTAHFMLKEWIADLRPVDACTVYKAQGSTYHTVFVDLTDIGKCTNYEQAARLLYVACSRATDKIYLYGQLPDRYFNKA